MIPNVFVSSTILDFHHLRDAIRDTINELGYMPVMSDYGDIGYLPTLSAEDSCYLTMRDCGLAVILIGKRYGSLSRNGLSVTHNEFRTARQENIPVICLVDREVVAYKRIYDANVSEGSVPIFPGMDTPDKTFEFINEFINSSVNNGFLDFGNVSDVRLHLKRQIAHLFGELLRNRFEPLRSGIQDVLSEIKTLSFELLKNDKATYQPLLATFRFLLNDVNNNFTRLLECMFGNIDEAVPCLVDSKTFDEFTSKCGWVYEVKSEEDMNAIFKEKKLENFTIARCDEFVDYFKDDEILLYGRMGNNNLVLSQTSKDYFVLKYKQYRDFLNKKLKKQ